jgi:sensor histidine kinase YesM
LDFCDNYLLLEKMRFKDRFNYKISVAEVIDKNYLIPKLLIQIHAENALKHGLATLESGGIILINVENVDGGILIEISDNGIGREKAKNQAKQSTGKGLEIMNELYTIYNKYYNEKVSSQINDLYDINGNACGTKVCIRIKQNEKS